MHERFIHMLYCICCTYVVHILYLCCIFCTLCRILCTFVVYIYFVLMFYMLYLCCICCTCLALSKSNIFMIMWRLFFPILSNDNCTVVFGLGTCTVIYSRVYFNRIIDIKYGIPMQKLQWFERKPKPLGGIITLKHTPIFKYEDFIVNRDLFI